MVDFGSRAPQRSGQTFLVTVLRSATPLAQASFLSEVSELLSPLSPAPSSCIRHGRQLTDDANENDRNHRSSYTSWCAMCQALCSSKQSPLAIVVIIMANFIEYVPGPCVTALQALSSQKF